MNIRICLLLLVLAFTSKAQETKEVDLKTSITGVKVFSQGAQINRTGKLTLGSGRSTIRIKSLSPYIDENSIQVKGNGNFMILSVNHRLDYLAEQVKNEQVDSLKRILDKLDKEISQENAWIEVMESKKKLLEENQKLGGTETGISFEQLNRIVEYYTAQLKSIKENQINSRIKLEELKKERTKIQNQINQISGRNELPSSEILVTVDSRNGSRAELMINYFTQNAGWTPLYDIRVNDISSPVQLDYKANIYQNTREDWNNVQLTLSNGNPNKSGIAPELTTWYLNFFQEKPYMSKRMNAMGAASRAEAPMMQESVAYDQEMVMEDASLPTTTIRQNQTTVEIEVTEKYTIASDGDQLTVSLQQYDIDALYEYYAVPKLDKDAFLMARIISWDQYNLLPGEANLFFEGTFVGNSFLDTYNTSDTLDVSLGRDPGIAIERKKMDIYSKTNFIGSNKIETRGFDILIRNPKSTPINITIFDQVPVSTREEISVSPEEISGGELNKNSGEITWDLTIGAGEQKKLELRYEVKYPKKERVILE